MGHLKSDELIDLAEGTRLESSAPHLQRCGDCQRQLADLRAMMAAAAEVDVPEPSPLFWDHFSARVHEAVAAEDVPRRAPWFNTFALPLSVAACAAIVVVTVVTMRPGGWLHLLGGAPVNPVARVAPVGPVGPVGPGGPGGPVGPGGPGGPVGDDKLAAPFPDDPSLDMVADLAAQVDWDMAVSPGLETHEDASAKAVAQLSAGERRELQRLLKEELSRANEAGN
jgi:hypothetical protein